VVRQREYRQSSLAHQALDLVSMGSEAEEHALVDEHGGNGEPPGEPEGILAGCGITSDVAHLHRGAARLKEGERGLTVRDAFHGEEHDLLHGPSTIPFPAVARDGAALTPSGASASIRPLDMTTSHLFA